MTEKPSPTSEQIPKKKTPKETITIENDVVKNRTHLMKEFRNVFRSKESIYPFMKDIIVMPDRRHNDTFWVSTTLVTVNAN